MSDEVKEPTKSPVAEEPEESASSKYRANCTVAAILAFGAPILFLVLLTTTANTGLSGFGGFVVLLCPIVALLSVVGFIWGLVAMISGDPSKKVAAPPNLRGAPTIDRDGNPF
jgi:hypothetical protein